MAFFSLTREKASSTFRVPVTAGSINFFLWKLSRGLKHSAQHEHDGFAGVLAPPLDPNPGHWFEHDSVAYCQSSISCPQKAKWPLCSNRSTAMFSSRNGFIPPYHCRNNLS
uniref:Uncharacterized protein n=1 Tax=Salix viminalis TaxID=40686 RepID=A0A6N2K395_SALVM